MSRVVVRIDKIILRGFAPAERSAMVAALQAELTRTLAAAAGPARSMRMPVLSLGRLPQQQGAAGAAKLGTGIGGRLGRRLSE